MMVSLIELDVAIEVIAQATAQAEEDDNDAKQAANHVVGHERPQAVPTNLRRRQERKRVWQRQCRMQLL
uniref:Uncharacterized protein n=1 Tax=Melanopsichium pennsylvanicum 4 TaxID=1398559 RepID=A0A077R3T3_9BASI|nr:uncharacterized protein BN887_06026 [Melanopsichium pennsylvanicum 4]